MKKPLVLRIAIGAGVLVAFGFLFMRSLQDARSTPYTVERQHLRGWVLVLEAARGVNDPLLVLRPPQELSSSLFRQIFSRAMESMNSPVTPAVPVVLRGEFDRVVGDQLTQEAMLAAARAARLESSEIAPRCIVYRRVSEPGGTRQVYFVSFDAPAISRFRDQIGLDPAMLAPILFVAGAGSDFNHWLPQRVHPDADCLAPVSVID
jgi:hypothetical protein